MWSLRFITSLVPDDQFSGCTTGAPFQADVDCPELQEVLAKKPACSLVDNVSLGLQLPPSGSGCLSPEGDGAAGYLLSPLFCEWVWRHLRLGLFAL